ncbi:MAG: hypothetical protein E6R03_08915 [Hyphomicrobiaceae bacterium]|nr:MAG: hypothetical protein E6R03_08915 [Hyphomicrobiaceae bacterium]
MDPSLRNWGWALGHYNLGTGAITIDKVGLIQPTLPTKKTIRVNHLDMISAASLAKGAHLVMRESQATFVEVPHGSQNARSMASYGICVGVLGTLRYGGQEFYELSELECKMASVGKKTATKAELIAWATKKHPEVTWPTYTRSGTVSISEAQAEHMADAVIAIHAGVSSIPFQQLLPMLAKAQ